MNRRSKIIVFVLFFALLWLPLIQRQTKWFREKELGGVYNKPVKPDFNFDTLLANKFQPDFEKYEDWNFGFRTFLIKIKNSINYLLFDELSVKDNIIGKDGLIFKISSIEQTLGMLYGEEKMYQETISKIKFMKDGIEHRGGHFLCIITPTKEKVLQDMLPSYYHDKYRLPNEYNTFIEGFKKSDIKFIDFFPYFKKLRDTCKYGVYPKSGFHWSMYSSSYAQDSLVSYLEHEMHRSFPKYRRTGFEISDTARESDNDFEPPLNLFFNLGQDQYVYPKYEMVKGTENNYKPRVLIIGDSYFWQLKAQHVLKDVFDERSNYWYYFGENSFPIGDVPGVPIKQLDRMREIQKADYVILMGNISTLDWFPYDVQNFYYDCIAKPGLVNSIKGAIKGSCPENELDFKARSICRDAKRTSLKAGNGRFVSAGGQEIEELMADRTSASDWEHFSFFRLDKERVAISSYKNLFLSAELGRSGEITSSREGVSDWEIFTVVNVDNSQIALKAANGKFLSMDENTGRLLARSGSIGRNERFITNFEK